MYLNGGHNRDEWNVEEKPEEQGLALVDSCFNEKRM